MILQKLKADAESYLGEKIEKVYGTGKQSVSILEQYCENLYLLTISLQDADQMQKLCAALNQQIQSLRDIMDIEFPNKLEVVFFPYKVSMWDSLESVYLAAKEDEDCEAYCVPIPYFDRNSDYSFGQMHYEGGKYPKDIEIMDWKDYDLAERRPDVIYIHNPYDDRNFVTSVLPVFNGCMESSALPPSTVSAVVLIATTEASAGTTGTSTMAAPARIRSGIKKRSLLVRLDFCGRQLA